MSRKTFTPAVAALTVLAAATLVADTLVLRNGRRIEGRLISVYEDQIEFKERYGRAERFDRYEVARIELEGDRGAKGALGSRPSGLRERVVSVPANQAWIDTGIDVRRGQNVYFDASGKVRWGKDRTDGPEGEGRTHFNANRPIPNRQGAALIGKIGGGSADAFFIGGERGPVRMPAAGRLHLGINDDFLGDNSGSFRVTVAY